MSDAEYALLDLTIAMMAYLLVKSLSGSRWFARGACWAAILALTVFK